MDDSWRLSPVRTSLAPAPSTWERSRSRGRLPTREASSTTITWREVSPPPSLRSARSWVSDELGIPVPASRSAAVRAATAVPMTL